MELRKTSKFDLQFIKVFNKLTLGLITSRISEKVCVFYLVVGMMPSRGLPIHIFENSFQAFLLATFTTIFFPKAVG